MTHVYYLSFSLHYLISVDIHVIVADLHLFLIEIVGTRALKNKQKVKSSRNPDLTGQYHNEPRKHHRLTTPNYQSLCCLETKTNVPTLLPMDSAPAQRRLRAINGHIASASAADSESLLRLNPTAGEFFSGAPSVSLCLIFSSSILVLVLNFDRMVCTRSSKLLISLVGAFSDVESTCNSFDLRTRWDRECCVSISKRFGFDLLFCFCFDKGLTF